MKTHYLNASRGMVVVYFVQEKVFSLQSILITGSLREMRVLIGKKTVITNICIILYGLQSNFTFIISFDISFLFPSMPPFPCARPPSRLAGQQWRGHTLPLSSLIELTCSPKLKGGRWGLSCYSNATDKLPKTQSLNKYPWVKRSTWLNLSQRCWFHYSITTKWG